MQSPYIKSLTSLRAIAALMVFLHHFNFLPYFDLTFLNILYFQGFSGVSLFFVLSGFLIHKNYSNKLQLTSKDLTKYWVNRFARIYPMYFIILTLTLLAYSGERNFFKLFINFFLLKGFSSIHLFSGVATAWSLTTEECFYLAFPLILYLLRKNWSLFKILTTIYVVGLFLFIIGQTANYEGFFNTAPFMLGYTFFGRAFEFIIGIAASIVLKSNDSFVYKIKNITYKSILYNLLILLSMTYVAYTHSTDGEFQLVSSTYPLGLILNNFFLPLGFAALIIGLTIEKTILRKLLDTNFMELIGRSSYVFYLLQGGWFYSFYSQIHDRASNLELYIAMNITAIFMYKYIEEPLNKKIKNMYIKYE